MTGIFFICVISMTKVKLLLRLKFQNLLPPPIWKTSHVFYCTVIKRKAYCTREVPYKTHLSIKLFTLTHLCHSVDVAVEKQVATIISVLRRYCVRFAGCDSQHEYNEWTGFVPMSRSLERRERQHNTYSNGAPYSKIKFKSIICLS